MVLRTHHLLISGILVCFIFCQHHESFAQDTRVQWGVNGDSSALNSDQGGSIELGAGSNAAANPISGGTPYIDFHDGNGSAQDYNFRIINDGDQQLSFTAPALGSPVFQLTPYSATVYGSLYIKNSVNQGVLYFADGTYMASAVTLPIAGDGISVTLTKSGDVYSHVSVDSSVARRSVAQTFTGNQTVLGDLIVGENGGSGGGIAAVGGFAVSNNYNGVLIQGTCINIGVCMDLNQSGQIHTSGGFFTGGADFAESVTVDKSQQYQPGDVMIIDASGRRQFTVSNSPYSTLVAGVYSTRPGVVASTHPMNDAAFKGEIPLAVVGIVPCRVSGENGPIRPGDLLVSASTPGYAMKGTDHVRMQGAVLGKALGRLDSNTGIIDVLVTLQ